ncbi:MAG: putative lipid II flippase FtsW [Spirochaetia bacterium]|jgi:cell division protein FtsW
MERVEKERGDIVLVMLVIAILGVGTALLFSASYSFSARTFQDPLYLVKRQLLWTALGALAAFIVSLTPMEVFRRALPLLLLATLVASLLPFLPGVGTRVLGSRRWITLFGMSFQPSEIVKVTLILYLASYFARREESEGIPLDTLIPPFIVVCVFAAIILLQNDYSTAIFIVVTGLSMLFIARVRTLHFLLVTLLTGTLGFLLLFTREHRVQRLLAYFDLSSYRSGTGYQIVNARAALAGGGFWGRGLGRSIAKLGPLPMAHSDFIYTIIGEETGLLGALFVLILFALLAWRGFQISLRAPDSFSSYVAFGVTAAISLQALLNMAVAVGLVPTTGVTLPFFSAGGSSLFATLVMCGLLVNLSRRTSSV